MINHHPKIVTNGLVLNVDPANPKSYPAKDDPYVGNVSLLLPFDGANGSTSVSDMSLNNFTVTANGNAQISTAQSKFGGSSVSFDGSAAYLSSSTGNILNFGTGDFTVECWIYLNNTTANATKGIITGMASTSFGLRVGQSYLGNVNGLGVYKAAIADCEYCSYSFSAATWYHIAVVRNSGTILFFINGIQQTTLGSGISSFNCPSTTSTRIGTTDGTVEYFNGYIDDLRVTKAARYTANFTPPDRLTTLPGRIYDLTTNKGMGSFVGSGVSYSSTNAGIVTLDGSNGYGVLPNTLTVGPTSTFTLCAWVNYISRPTGGVARRPVLVDSVNTNDFEAILGFPYTYSSSQMGLEVGKAGVQSQTAYSTYTNNLNQWYYLTGLFKNGSADFYINGVYQSTVTYNATINSATAHSRNWGIGGGFFNGSISSPYANCRVGPIQVYNRNLTPSEITQNYNAAKGRFGL